MTEGWPQTWNDAVNMYNSYHKPKDKPDLPNIRLDPTTHPPQKCVIWVVTEDSKDAPVTPPDEPGGERSRKPVTGAEGPGTPVTGAEGPGTPVTGAEEPGTPAADDTAEAETQEPNTPVTASTRADKPETPAADETAATGAETQAAADAVSSVGERQDPGTPPVKLD
tara:strand:- start:87 stop:587 length:501 start_codon:yes stop_codon:yes gene_type:complete